MNTMIQTTITKALNEQRQAIIDLLEAEKLPTADLPATLDHFFVALDDNSVIGAIGLELYGNSGLLRSLAVHPLYRNKNIAAHLLQSLEAYAASLGLDSLYLLTETASGYFSRKGFQKIERDIVPANVQGSTEFSHVCPASAIVMQKQVLANPTGTS